MRNRSIWSFAADSELIQPLLGKYPRHRKVGSSKSYFFSAWLADIDSAAAYDFIDYSDQELTGQELYDKFVSQINDNGFLGELRFTKAQGYLLQDYANSITLPEGV